MQRRGSIVGLSNHLKGGLRLFIGNKNAGLSSFADLVGSQSACWEYQMPAFSTTRSSFSEPTPSPGECEPAQHCCGHPKLPWEPEVQLLGRNDAQQKVERVVEEELSQAGAARNLWHVAYAAGRSGSGKTEIGKQLPRILAQKFEKDSLERALLCNAAYLLIDCNAGGDAFEEDDFPLEPGVRLGWRLLAAVCRDSLDLIGVRELRHAISHRGSEHVARELKGKGFPNVAELLRGTRRGGQTENLGYRIFAKDVLGALAIDLRRDPKSDERIAIIVHVDEHQLMWGWGLPTNADETQKLQQHKEFLYDLCTLRGDGDETWCLKNNIFLFPIFSGTASTILASLFGPTNFVEVHLKFEPFTAEDARTLFLRELKSPHESWLDKKSSDPQPLDFVLSELGRIPRLIINGANNPQVREIFSKDCYPSSKVKKEWEISRTKCSLDLIYHAFDIVSDTLYHGLDLTEQLTRLIVAGVEVDMETIVDGRTIAQHEFDGAIIQKPLLDPADVVPKLDAAIVQENVQEGERAEAAAKHDGAIVPHSHYRNPTGANPRKFAIRVPAMEYRAAVLGIPGLQAISAFANLEYSCPGWNGRGQECIPWPELFERMMLERLQNMLVVHRDILKRTKPLTIEELYPRCVSWRNPAVRLAFPLPASRERLEGLSLCHNAQSRKQFVYDSRGWLTALQLLREGCCSSELLTKEHPAFDVIHLFRKGKVLHCFLEQLKNRNTPTRDLLSQRHQETSETVRAVLKKFLPAMVRMTAAAKKQGLELQFIPVYCDRRMPTDADVRFWLDFWTEKAGIRGLTIAAAVVGSQMALPSLFPCLGHRFVLLEEQSLKPPSDTVEGVDKDSPLNSA
jgi:hypothetical protein